MIEQALLVRCLNGWIVEVREDDTASTMVYPDLDTALDALRAKEKTEKEKVSLVEKKPVTKEEDEEGELL